MWGAPLNRLGVGQMKKWEEAGQLMLVPSLRECIAAAVTRDSRLLHLHPSYADSDQGVSR